MTPFGERLRALRRSRGETARALAQALGVSPAYLSALEHGHRGRPSRRLVELICQHYGIIWDEAEALQRLARSSHPRVVIDTSGLSPEHVALANELAATIRTLSEGEATELLTRLRRDRGAAA